MKRTFRTLLVLCCLALCLTFCLTACGGKCEHTYDNGCDAICNECEETREVGAHDWSAATCTASKTCSVCGATEGEALGHEWTTPDVDLCEVQSTCSRCGATDGQNKEHSWVEANCTTPKTCSTCGNTTGTKLGHSPNEDDGDCSTEVRCSVCNEITTPAGQHTPNNDDGDCTTPITCSVCGTTTTPANDNHTGGTATCTDKAICTLCNTAYGTVDANNHIDENTDHICDRECGKTDIGTHADGNTDHACDYGCSTTIGTHADTNSDHNCEYGCSTTIGVHSDSENDDDHTCDYGCGVTLEDCKGGTATCTAKAECAICGTAYGELAPDNHIDSNTDHICDRGCGETNIGTHEDKNNDHICEYGCTTSIGTHADSENDDDHTCDHGCGATLEDCKGGTATCVSGKVCDICGVEYDLTKNPENHASTEFTYTDNLDGTHTKAHKCCEVVENATEKHTFGADNKCSCGAALLKIEQVIMSVFDVPFGEGWSSDEEELDGVSGDVEDEGKTAWEVGDQIIITITSKYYGTRSCAITYNGKYWDTEVSFYYLEGETPTVSVIYAPCYEVTEEGVMQLRSGMQLGMTEYLVGEYEIGDGFINVSFENATRNYSRLRIVGLPNQELTVTTTDFTPAGATSEATDAYTLTTDEKGNAYLYGTFAEGATIVVMQGNAELAHYTFSSVKNPGGTLPGISYALDAKPFIDGTLNYKGTATEEDVNVLVEQLKAYVDNGITTIIVTGSEPAMIDMGSWTNTAIGEAIYRLSGNGYYDENNQYNGKIDLILQDVTKIGDQEFYSAWVLNSITLPKVTTIGDGAFYDCRYLQTITFGTLITEIADGTYSDFHRVGENVEGCDLVLNSEQVNAATEYQPNIETNMWWNTEWKSITLD